MRVLVTGAEGFVGGHLVPELRQAGHTPLQLVLDRTSRPDADAVCDIRDQAAMRTIVARLAPDACIHLAGIAFVPQAWEEPERTFDINVTGTLTLLDTFRREAPNARVLVVTSAVIYGAEADAAPISESHPFNPNTLYAASKAAADQAALLYGQYHGLPVMTVRPNNHTGPGQSTNFVIPSFARQLAAMRGQPTGAVLRVGNLESRRDFLDVRDVVRAYRLLIESGAAHQAYNVGAGQLVTIREALELLMDLTGVHPELEVDKERYRPTDASPLLDTARIREDVGWSPRRTLRETVADIIADGLA